METLNQREKKDAVPAPFGTLFLPFLKVSEVPNRQQRPFLPGVNMEKGFTSQSDGLATTHQVPLRYLLRNGTAAFHRWSSGYSAQFLPSSLVWLSQQVRFGLLCKIFSQCWTLRNQQKGKDVKQGFGSPTNCQQPKPSTPCIWKQIARPSTSKDGTN